MKLFIKISTAFFVLMCALTSWHYMEWTALKRERIEFTVVAKSDPDIFSKRLGKYNSTLAVRTWVRVKSKWGKVVDLEIENPLVAEEYKIGPVYVIQEPTGYDYRRYGHPKAMNGFRGELIFILDLMALVLMFAAACTYFEMRGNS